jgi:hypothetical protein
MRGTRTVLALGFFALVLITGSSARSAADDCLAEPNGPAPQGQHWYYRIDHANNGRQCWYLRAETGRAQKTSRQTESNSSNAMAAPTQPTAPAAETPLKNNRTPAAAPIPWLNVQKLPEPISFVQPVTQQKSAAQTQSDGAAAVATSGSAVPERVIDPPAAVPIGPAANADSNATSTNRAREQQRRQPAQARPEPPAPANVHIDHTFALLMIMFTALAIAGPALNFVERRRRRKTVNFRPPQWARVVAPKAPTPSIRPVPRPRVAKPPTPMPIRPPDQTERLAQALQQLVDRLQAADRHEPRAARVGPRGRASM